MNAFNGSPRSKIKSLAALCRSLQKERRCGKKIVFTNGCFDLLHVGHIRYLSRAKRLGQCLVVGLNSDASVAAIKGPSRPINKQGQRAEVLSALSCVDYVTIFHESTPLCLIQKVRPDILVKGGDWKKKAIVGGDWVRAAGGRVYSLPFVAGFSTTKTLSRVAAGRRRTSR
jgi:rfaE bifunctional protein nucleotidyltransferase chain/domain